ncbi:MAG: transposase, partial [Chloroflexi bacterium]|nr:transposase [Chloroflexota bacterium]
MGESTNPLKVRFDRRVRLEFRSATITSDAGLLAVRELDEALGLTERAAAHLKESRTGRNVQHQLVPLLRQSVYSRLAGYEDTNDAERLAQDPAMRVIAGWRGAEKPAASTNSMSRFETEVLTRPENLEGLARMNARWVERAMAHTRHQRV